MLITQIISHAGTCFLLPRSLPSRVEPLLRMAVSLPHPRLGAITARAASLAPDAEANPRSLLVYFDTKEDSRKSRPYPGDGAGGKEGEWLD